MLTHFSDHSAKSHPNDYFFFSVTDRSPWNKYNPEANKKTLPKGRGELSERKKKKLAERDQEPAGEGGEGGGKKVPPYMKPTTSSKKHEYLEDEEPSRPNQSPRRAAAWK
jgi:hypothetical protein